MPMPTLLLLMVLSLQVSDEVAASVSSYLQGERWDFRITRDALQNSPTWPAEEATPPLPEREAIAIASDQLRELFSDWRLWSLRMVSLRPIGSEARWIYVISFAEPPPTRVGGLHSTLELVVLMNGQTISPVRTPWPPE
jgi:hypothetical protein